MALEYRHAAISLTGLDTKTDDKNIIDGRLILAENVVMQKTGKLESRAGFSRYGSTTYSSPIALASVGSTFAVLQQNGQVVYPESDNKTSEAAIPVAAGRHTPISYVENISNPTGLDFASNGSYGITAKRSGTGTVAVMLFNISSGVIENTTELFATSNSIFRVAMCPEIDVAFVVYRESSNWKLVKITTTAVTEYTITAISTWTSSAQVDIVACTASAGVGHCFVIASRASDGRVELTRFETSGNTFDVTSTLRAAGSATTLPPAVYAGPGNTFSRVCLCYQSSASNIRGYVYGTAVDYTHSTAIAEVFAVAAVENGATLWTAYEYCEAAPFTDANLSPYATDVVVRQNGFSVKTINGAILGPKCFTEKVSNTPVIPVYSVGVLGEIGASPANVAADYIRCQMIFCAFNSSDYTVMFCAGQQQALPPYYLGSGGSKTVVSYRSSVFSSATVVNYSVPIITLFFASAPNKATVNYASIQVSAFASSSETQLPSVVGLKNVVATNAWGNIALLGNQANSMAFPLFAIPPTSPAQIYYQKVASGGSLGTGTWQVLVAFEGTDSKGNRFWSLASRFSFTFAAGSANLVNVYIKSGTWFASQISGRVEVYLSSAGGTILYKKTSTTNTSGGIAVVLDTTGVPSNSVWPYDSVLEPSSPPPATAIGVARNRLWASNALKGDEVWFSKAFVPNELPQFNDALTIYVPTTGGRVQSIAEMDDKIVIFKETEIYATYGDGPDENGANTYPTPQRITQTLGCRDPRSVVLTDAGLIFKSHEGIWLLSRGMELAYIGKDVEAYNAEFCVDAINLVEQHRVWFFQSSGNTLVWDEFHQLWTVFTGQTATCGAMLPTRKPAFLRSGQLLYENSAVFTDNGTQFGIRIRTGWIAAGQIQGFERVRKITWLGTINAADSQTMALAYDFSGSTFETFTASAASIGTPFQWQGKPKRQKCEAFQITLSMAALTSQVTLSGFGLEMGIKAGTNRLPAAKRVQGV